MGDVHYMISEAAKQVSVETHVLRYWEEELSLEIGRTEMGHRYYTQDDIQLFDCIKKLKEQGMQLKDLKSLVPCMIHTKKRLKEKRMTTIIPPLKSNKESKNEELENLLRDVLLENNEILSQTIVKGMDFLLQAKERQEEERYRNLDQLIRKQQEAHRERMKTSFITKFKKLWV